MVYTTYCSILFIYSNNVIKMPNLKCDGECSRHGECSGEVHQVSVIDNRFRPIKTYNFNYCHNAILTDIRRGFIVQYIKPINIFQAIDVEEIISLYKRAEDLLEKMNLIIQQRFDRSDLYAEANSSGISIIFKDSITPLADFEKMITNPNFDPWDLVHKKM